VQEMVHVADVSCKAALVRDIRRRPNARTAHGSEGCACEAPCVRVNRAAPPQARLSSGRGTSLPKHKWGPFEISVTHQACNARFGDGLRTSPPPGPPFAWPSARPTQRRRRTEETSSRARFRW